MSFEFGKLAQSNNVYDRRIDTGFEGKRLVQGPLQLAVPASSGDEDGKLGEPPVELGVVAEELAKLLGAVGEFRAVEPDSEGAVDVAPGLENGIVNARLLLIQVGALELAYSSGHG